MNKPIKHTFLAGLSLITLFVFAGCDQNTASPEDLGYNDDLSIAQFTSSTNAAITIGSQIEFTVKISDQEKEFDHLVITDGFDETDDVTAANDDFASGTFTVKPACSSNFTLELYAKGENTPRTSQTIHVDVVDLNNSIVIEPGTDEICNDGKDNNYNTMIDCDDPDCSADAACVDKYKITYTLEPASKACHSCEGIENCSCSWSTSAETDQPEYTQGDEVTIEWQAPGCSYITLLDENEVEYYYQPIKDGSYVVKLTDDVRAVDENNDKTYAVKLYCLVEGYDLPTSEAAIEIKAYVAPVTEAPTFNATFTTSVSSPSIIKGDTIIYTWDITSEYTAANVNYLGEDHPITEKKGSVTLDAGDYGDETSVVFTITITDANGLTNDSSDANTERTVDVETFESCSDCASFGEVEKVVPGYTDGVYFILTRDNKIHKTSDYAKTAQEVADFGSKKVTVFTPTSNENSWFAGTSDAIYKYNGRLVQSVLVLDEEPTAIYAEDADNLLIATNTWILKAKPKSGDSCGGGWYFDDAADAGYCWALTTLGAFTTADHIVVSSFIPFSNQPSTVLATVNDVGTYISKDAGNVFESDKFSSNTFLSGYITEASSYLWNSTGVFSVDLGTLSIDSTSIDLGGLPSTRELNYVLTTRGIQFVALESGLYYMLDGETVFGPSNITESVKVLMWVNSEHVLRTITATGKVYDLSISQFSFSAASGHVLQPDGPSMDHFGGR